MANHLGMDPVGALDRGLAIGNGVVEGSSTVALKAEEASSVGLLRVDDEGLGLEVVISVDQHALQLDGGLVRVFRDSVEVDDVLISRRKGQEEAVVSTYYFAPIKSQRDSTVDPSEHFCSACWICCFLF